MENRGGKSVGQIDCLTSFEKCHLQNYSNGKSILMVNYKGGKLSEERGGKNDFV